MGNDRECLRNSAHFIFNLSIIDAMHVLTTGAALANNMSMSNYIQ
jgi:hypothetical protein